MLVNPFQYYSWARSGAGLEQGNVAVGTPKKIGYGLFCAPCHIPLNHCTSGMRVCAPCLSLFDLALQRPPHTSLETVSCRSVFGLPSRARARSFDQG